MGRSVVRFNFSLCDGTQLFSQSYPPPATLVSKVHLQKAEKRRGKHLDRKDGRQVAWG